MELHTGTLVADKYEILEVLGKGGFGVVYRAHDHKLDRQVALKMVLSGHDQAGDAFMKRFDREIRLVRQLEHPNIVRLYDFGEENGVPFMVMELVRGVEVSDYLNQNGAMNPLQARGLMMQMLDGLYTAHEAGIIHRDLKPNNLMLTAMGMRTDFLKIFDFGIAKAIEGSERDNKLTFQTRDQVVGTPSYMAPELLRQEGVTAASDIYSAGLIFAELLNGHAVLEGTMIQVMAAHINPGPHTLPEAVRCSPFVRVIERAIAKEPSERYRDAREMYQAIEAIPLGVEQTGSLPLFPQTSPNRMVTGPQTPSNITPSQLPQAAELTEQLDAVSKRRFSLIIGVLVLAVLAGIGVFIWLLLSKTTLNDAPPQAQAGERVVPSEPQPETPPTEPETPPTEPETPPTELQAPPTELQAPPTEPETPPTEPETPPTEPETPPTEPETPPTEPETPPTEP
ncbi:MAG: serine/threonine-protein kinase, partial [Myxococcota bacterium]|nr:serine/threonine-protein kinase [Myxococcota bacterium]